MIGFGFRFSGLGFNGNGRSSRRLGTTGSRWAGLTVAVALAVMVFGGARAQAGSLSAFSDADLTRGFMATVFGLEHGGGFSARQLKKFHGPVRFSVDDHSSAGRAKTVEGFIRKLPGLVRGLDARMARSSAEANFKVVIVDRDSYVTRVRADAYGGHRASVSGNCMVKVDFDANGISRATAFIRGDDESLFRRCMVEEILQGLGPMNDNRGLTHSMFNDSSPHTKPMPFDLAIVAALYDRRLHHGMGRREAAAVLPEILADVRRRQK